MYILWGAQFTLAISLQLAPHPNESFNFFGKGYLGILVLFKNWTIDKNQFIGISAMCEPFKKITIEDEGDASEFFLSAAPEASLLAFHAELMKDPRRLAY
ncbi:hypothetical protein BDD14_3269 [Edaphobacter modestus]|uniref:Uncharacterized protein n=1 Tax=Edaphobacter modestus TaxID=388466 RepID=A0A4Q7YXC4_9BACT|nr:hypothetical protein BDD14_3269 [Edaphobacter modestus]